MTDTGRPSQIGPDDDVVALLKAQHVTIRELFQEVESSTGDQQRDAWRRLVRMLAVHETAEEEVVHPTARRAFDSGEQVVAERLEEERQAKEQLSRLDDMGPEDPAFMSAFLALRQAVLAHADAEEREEFAQLQQHTDADKLSAMAKAVKAAEAMAPTRPHPGVESAAANIAVGPFAAIVDRTRDAVRKAMGQNG
ncbi:hemerythrin domain-containing protein [Streptomyces olindensis]|uniref:Hemerythrin domain-containing protein n=1 Tax=Streptomyces olindensis TaxID=358823 RepID=A0ABV2XQA3_9ACTN